MRLVAIGSLAVGMVLAGGAVSGRTQTAPSAQQAVPEAAQSATSTGDATVTGGRLHGVAKSGNVPLPGVTVTAQNTLTGKRYSTTTDISGAWSLTIPQNGRYVIRTQFAAFAAGSQEALLNATSHDHVVDFDLMLASRAQAAQARQDAAGGAGAGGAGTDSAGVQAIRQLAGNGAQSLSLTSSLNADTETQQGTAAASGAALPSIAGNSDFSSDSVAISGQSGAVSQMSGADMDRLRDAMETIRAQNGGQFPGGGGGLFGGGPGGFGGFGGGFGGPGGGGRGNFRGFNPGQPHGSVFWFGTNSALNAEPFALDGQQQEQPASGSNRFGITFMSAPYLPHLTKPSGKDTVFLTLSGQRQSNPLDEYAFVPTDAERQGIFTGLAPIYDPTISGVQFPNNVIPSGPNGRIVPQAAALMQLYPQPNLTPSAGINYNYHLLTTAQTNSTQAGVRYNRSLGKNASLPGGFGGGGRGGGGGGRRNQNQGLRQSINVNYNWSESAQDNVNFIPELGGKSASASNSVQAGYTVGYHKVTNIFNANWNRSNSHTTNYFTNTANNIAGNDGITVPNDVPLNYGIPSIQLSEFSGLSEQQPSFSVGQTISFSEVLSWIHGKNNFRFGGDYRRVHRDFLAGSTATGSFTFTGLFTEDPTQAQSQNPTTGSPVADFLLGLPQSTSLNSSVAKSYLRDNVYDLFAQDDWRVMPSVTLNLGLRWELFEPYTEKYGHLGEVVSNPDGGFTSLTEAASGSAGLPDGLVYPWHKAFAPRVGIAWRVPKVKQFVVRAGYGVNYTVGEYSTFGTTMAHQPPFTNQQTNQEAVGNTASSECARTVPMTCFTLAEGFPAPAVLGNYALDPHYPLPYVQAWNLDLQKSLPWQVVLNLGYNGSRGNHLDTVIEPRAIPSSPKTDPTPSTCAGSTACLPLNFRYEEAVSFSKFNAATVRVNKRLTQGISLGANYQYSHSIDDAGALGSVGGVGVQDWQNPLGELGNSSLDVRHTVSGTYLYELPFGKDKFWVTSGAGSHILEGFSVSGTFQFATGGWLSPSFTSSVASTACGTGGVLRPNLTGAPVTAGGGTLHQWFNPAAYVAPTNTPGFCNFFGDAPRNSIQGPGTVSNNMALSKTVGMGDTRSMEIRATISNVFNTVQYSGIGTTVNSPNFGEVTSAAAMRAFQFTARFRF